MSGTYQISGDKLTLNHAKLSENVRTISTVNGVDVLWREDGLSLWVAKKRIHPYAVLIRVKGATQGPLTDGRPSIEILKSQELRDRDKKDFEERDNDKPPEVREILRARSRNKDPDREEYRREIARAQAQLDPKLIAELVGLLGRDSENHIRVKMMLDDIYGTSILAKDPPPFLKDETAKRKALEALIAALSRARDRTALEDTLMVFLRVSGIGKIDLAVPETGIVIRLEARSNGGTWDSQGTPMDDINWLKLMSKLIPACQQWMRGQIQK